ncbi:hypothetical protein ACRAQ7_11775 [Erythrobacter sp. W53]|uniref:hypothetical protein n=1 Tax=Erythrobacter sp. W53 TaxID=3425947 RepID=UPI003D7698DE
MTVSKRTAVIWWLGGLVAFAVTLYLHMPLVTEGVPEGIMEHQRAPDAITVDAIQSSWAMDGLSRTAMIAMISDLIFIGIYGVGCVLAGLHYRAQSSRVLKALGWAALASGVVFLLTDYGETISQLIQLMRSSGDDQLAHFASTVRPIKMLTWISGFLTVLAALLIDHFSANTA